MTLTPEETKLTLRLLQGEPIEHDESEMATALEEKLRRRLDTVRDSDDLLVEFAMHIPESRNRPFVDRAQRAARKAFEALQCPDTTATVFDVSDADQLVTVDLLEDPDSE